MRSELFTEQVVSGRGFIDKDFSPVVRIDKECEGFVTETIKQAKG